MTEDPDGEVLDVGGPLRRQLEKLDVVPLHAVDSHCGAGNTVKLRRSATPLGFRGLWRTSQHGLLLLGGADEAADALDHLALGLHLLVFALFGQEHDWRGDKRETHVLRVNRGFALSRSEPSNLRGSHAEVTLPFLFFSLVTTVMDMLGWALSSAPPSGSRLTCSERKLHFRVFLEEESRFSTSFFLSVGATQ